MHALRWLSALLAGLAAVGALGCPAERTDSAPQQDTGRRQVAPDAGSRPDKPTYIATTTVVKLILDPLVGSHGRVETLLKPGASAHTYDPRPSDAGRIAGAAALIWVGRDYDGWAAQLPAAHSIELMPLVPPDLLLPAFGHAPHAEDSSAGAAESDPHFFTDPLAVAALLEPLAAELGKLDPAGAEAYRRNAAACAAQLAALHERLSTRLAPLYGQAVILMHPSFAYFLQRYGLQLAGVVEEFPGREPSPKYLAALTQVARERGVRAIFNETLLPPEPAQAIAEACRLPLYELDPSCGASARGYRDYADWLTYNAGVFSDALGAAQ